MESTNSDNNELGDYMYLSSIRNIHFLQRDIFDMRSSVNDYFKNLKRYTIEKSLSTFF